MDTPGQIEAFTWSASGQIITDLLASEFPTLIAYVVDTPRSQQPATFMSNMLYACSVMYKTRLPLVVLLNKTDVTPATNIEQWMHDFDAFQTALESHQVLILFLSLFVISLILSSHSLSDANEQSNTLNESCT